MSLLEHPQALALLADAEVSVAAVCSCRRRLPDEPFELRRHAFYCDTPLSHALRMSRPQNAESNPLPDCRSCRATMP